MANFVPPLFLIIYLILFVIALRLRRRLRVSALTLFMIPVAALIIDNLVIVISSQLQSSPILSSLNNFSLFLQALLIPIFVLVAFELVRRTNTDWAQFSWARSVIWTLTIVLIGFALYQQYASAQTTTTAFAQSSALPFEGVEETINLTVNKPSYVGALITAAIVAVFGYFIHRAIRWPWVLYGAVCMLILHALPLDEVGPLYAGLGKLFIAISLLGTAFRLYVLEPTPSATLFQGANA